MHKRRPPKPVPFYDRVVPTSAKFKDVKATLDTGYTVAKVKTINAKELSKRRDEVFYRIGKHSLADLYSEYESGEMESFQSRLNAPTGGPRIMTYEEEENPRYEKPYLILDVRDAWDFNKGHLIQARSYPYTAMRRDQTHPEIYNFKNKEGCLIIMYCDDEKISKDAAHLLVQRGCDNVYLLTGGLMEFAAHYPSYAEGEVPTSPMPSPGKPPRTSRAGLPTIGENTVSSPSYSRAPPLRATSDLRSGLSQMKIGNTARSRFRDDKSESGMTTHSNLSGESIATIFCRMNNSNSLVLSQWRSL